MDVCKKKNARTFRSLNFWRFGSFKKNIQKTVIEKEDQVFAEDEIPILVDYLKRNVTIWNLGVLLVLQTGVRVGELSALKPGDWAGGNILKIRRTEIRYKTKTVKTLLMYENLPKQKQECVILFYQTGE